MKKNTCKLLSGILSMALMLGAITAGGTKASALQAPQVPTDSETSSGVSSGPAVQPSAEPTITPIPVDVSQITISKITAIIRVGKTVTPVITGTNSPVTWSSADAEIATVDETGVVTGKKTGKTTITASVDGIIRICTVTVVAKMTNKDFSKFNSENFIHYCKRYHYDTGFAWNGQWKGGSKKKKTARGITIGSKKSKIQNAYGELTWKRCTSRDPFSQMKGLKKNKVKTYGDVAYGKYRIRFYLNSKKKVVAIIFACNINKIKKKHLKKYM